MMAVFSQLDKNTMLLRMRGGMLERVKQGYWMGGGNLPFCYTYDKEKGILVPIAERKIQANQAMDLFIQGNSDVKIMEILGYKNEVTVRNILTSVVNIGKIPYKGNVYQGLHEPIFNEEKFEMAQRTREQRRKKKLFTNYETNLLTGLCYCGVCGCAMRYQKWTNGKHKIYCCSRNKDLYRLPNYNPNCNNSLEWAADIEKQVEDKILEISLNIDSIAKDTKLDMDDILQQQLDNLNSKLKRMYNLYADGNDTIIETINDLEKQKKDIKEKLDLELKKELTKNKREGSIKEIKKIADVWEHIDKKGKNTILKSIIEKILIDNGNIEIVLKNF
jgi:site-specific DNA recombinase